jgi:hypothetical protein
MGDIVSEWVGTVQASVRLEVGQMSNTCHPSEAEGSFSTKGVNQVHRFMGADW